MVQKVHVHSYNDLTFIKSTFKSDLDLLLIKFTWLNILSTKILECGICIKLVKNEGTFLNWMPSFDLESEVQKFSQWKEDPIQS